jgi:hypothetical protein
LGVLVSSPQPARPCRPDRQTQSTKTDLKIEVTDKE